MLHLLSLGLPFISPINNLIYNPYPPNNIDNTIAFPVDNPNPFAVPLFVIVAPESIVSVEPDKTLKLLAVNLKSSAPAILISIWSSVSACKVVSPSDQVQIQNHLNR